MICPKCDGDGFFEIDSSYMAFGELYERWSMDKCKNCEGTGLVDDDVGNDVNSHHDKPENTEETS